MFIYLGLISLSFIFGRGGCKLRVEIEKNPKQFTDFEALYVIKSSRTGTSNVIDFYLSFSAMFVWDK